MEIVAISDRLAEFSLAFRKKLLAKGQKETEFDGLNMYDEALCFLLDFYEAETAED